MNTIEQKQQQIEATMRLAPVIPVVVIDDASARGADGARAGRRRHAGDRGDPAYAGRAGSDPRDRRRSRRRDDRRRHRAQRARSGGRAARPARASPCRPASRRACSMPPTTATLPLLPGAATASEVMTPARARLPPPEILPGGAGRRSQAARRLGQPAAAGPLLPHRRHQPGHASDFLALPNVICVGGSWLTPADKLAAGDWAGIELLAREAAGLRQTRLSLRTPMRARHGRMRLIAGQSRRSQRAASSSQTRIKPITSRCSSPRGMPCHSASTQIATKPASGQRQRRAGTRAPARTRAQPPRLQQLATVTHRNAVCAAVPCTPALQRGRSTRQVAVRQRGHAQADAAPTNNRPWRRAARLARQRQVVTRAEQAPAPRRARHTPPAANGRSDPAGRGSAAHRAS